MCSAVRSYFYAVLHGHHVLATSAKVLKHSLGISTDRQLISIKQFFIGATNSNSVGQALSAPNCLRLLAVHYKH